MHLYLAVHTGLKCVLIISVFHTRRAEWPRSRARPLGARGAAARAFGAHSRWLRTPREQTSGGTRTPVSDAAPGAALRWQLLLRLLLEDCLSLWLALRLLFSRRTSRRSHEQHEHREQHKCGAVHCEQRRTAAPASLPKCALRRHRRRRASRDGLARVRHVHLLERDEHRHRRALRHRRGQAIIKDTEALEVVYEPIQESRSGACEAPQEQSVRLHAVASVRREALHLYRFHHLRQIIGL